jgi:hypothetical protein
MMREMKMIELASMAVAMPKVEGHPNRVDFRGVLTVVDVASQRAPNGAKGHRVVLTRAAAEKALPSLMGMALDYAPELDRHDARCKVGVITSAEVVGANLEVGGYLYAKDFPEIVEEVAKSGRTPVKLRARTQGSRVGASGVIPRQAGGEAERLRVSLAHAAAEIRSLTAGIRKATEHERKPIVLRAEAADIGGVPGLGMSFEVTDVNVVDEGARLWTINHVTFTGAAVLRKSKAAYQDTWIELADREGNQHQ